MPTAIRVAFVGDSFVNGYGDPDHSGWVGRVCSRARARGHDVTGYNLGIRGDTSADVRRRWETEVRARLIDGEASLGVFSFGVNDCVERDGRVRVPSATAVEHAGEILDAAHALAPVLFVGPPPVADEATNRRIESLSARLAVVCADRAVPFLDIFARLRRSAAWMQEVTAGDGAHPGAGGYADLATLVESWKPWASRMP